MSEGIFDTVIRVRVVLVKDSGKWVFAGAFISPSTAKLFIKKMIKDGFETKIRNSYVLFDSKNYEEEA